MKCHVNLTKEKWLKHFPSVSSEASIIGTLWEEESFKKDLASEYGADYFKERIKDYSGFFSLVYQKGEDLFAAVDIIRSHPLFYGVVENNFYISDEADWVRVQVNDMEMDPIARDEFQLAGYVTGRDTLFPNVKQLQAGESLLIKDGVLTLDRYYLFTHTEPKEYNEEKLSKEFLRVSRESIQRLVNYAKGRQIVIPLSGGYDSRFIASLLKESGYENILCFTYGRQGNKEARVSKQVADALNFEWHYVEYTEAKWKEVWSTEDRKAYQYYASNLNSLPHFQDWLAIRELKEKGIVKKDAVFAPGHTGDMISGGHIPKYVFKDLHKTYQAGHVLEALLERHYYLAPLKEINSHIDVFKAKVEKALKREVINSAEYFADECELWNWQNRQAKFILNSVRVYEFFAFDWWTPMWDKPFVEFFKNLPLVYRNHQWYMDKVTEHFEKMNQKKEIASANEAFNLVGFISIKLRGVPAIRSFAKWVYHLKPKKNILASEGCYSKEEYKKLTKNGYHSNGIGVFFYLKELEKHYEDIKQN